MCKYTCPLFFFLSLSVSLSFSLSWFEFWSYSVSFSCSVSLALQQIESEWAPNHVQVQPETLPTLQTVILPGKLLSTRTHTHTHTDADCSVWQSIKSLWHLGCCTIIILQWIITQSFPSTGQSQGAGERQSERHIDWHISCNVRLQGQGVPSRACDSTGGNLNWGLWVCDWRGVSRERNVQTSQDWGQLTPIFRLETFNELFKPLHVFLQHW